MNNIHYVYQITNLKNNKIYIGVRTHPDPDNDNYMGSGTVIQKVIEIEGINNFKKYILNKFSTREEAENYESSLLTEEFCNDPDTYNLYCSGNLNNIKHGFRKDLWYDYYDIIRERYNIGETAREIGKYYKCDTGTIRKIVEDIKRTKSETQIIRFTKYKSGNRNKQLDNKIEDIKKWYNEGISLNQIGKRLGVSFGSIRTRLKESGIDIRESSKHTKDIPTNRKDIWKFKEEILLLYNKGLNLTEISNKYKCNPGVIKKIIIKHGINIRSKKDDVRYNKENKILDLYIKGINITSIQKITHTNFNIVKEIINKYKYDSNKK